MQFNMQSTCSISWETFEVGDHELKLRKQFWLEWLPTMKPKYRFQHLGAFWPHWNLHKRKCDKTEKEIVTVFRPDCPYPVWHKDVWMREADPPKAVFDFDRPFFEQAWELFRRCPIQHNTGNQNENCEYTDDWWHSRDCYLCHSWYECEKTRYCYRNVRLKDSIYCVYCFESENCIDLINSRDCHSIVYGVYLRGCSDSAFLYDCRNCSDCMFCFNLRNKKYCIGNKQFSKDEYLAQVKKWNLASKKGYTEAKKLFEKMMREMAWHRSIYVDMCESSDGNYLENCDTVTNTFFVSEAQDCVNMVRSAERTLHQLDTVCCPLQCEMIHMTSAAQVKCYDIKYCYQISETRSAQYCAYSLRLQDCFWCCGLVGGRQCVLNTPYSKSEYEELQKRIVDHMKSTGEYAQFFPWYFAPNPYDDSFSKTYWKLDKDEQIDLGFRWQEPLEKSNDHYTSVEAIPDNLYELEESNLSQVYWDEKAHRPFQILPTDLEIFKRLGVALPDTFYTPRLQEHFAWMPFDGELRTTSCAKSWSPIQTCWPAQYDGRILSEEEYLNVVV